VANGRTCYQCYQSLDDCYHWAMRQLITRLDDDLHARLKERAAAEGRSLNALIVEVLEDATASASARETIRQRARRTDRLVRPPRPSRVPSWSEVEAATGGTGTAVSEALGAERAAR
jgi:antitoxin FitA